jgi:hypothetical protein
MQSNPEWMIIVEIGDAVICDLSNAEYTDSPATGGVLSGSYACCPECTPSVIANATACGESDSLTLNSDKLSFADFVRRIRSDTATDEDIRPMA